MNLDLYYKELKQVTETADSFIKTIKEATAGRVDRIAEENEDQACIRRPMERRFRTREVTRMLGVSESGLYKAEREGRIPRAEYVQNSVGNRVRDGWTIDQLLDIRKVFNALPTVGHRPMVISFPNLKGGCWKTTLSLLSAQYYAISGYRVLLVDTDAQGTLSFFLGYQPDIDTSYEDTITPYLLFDDSAGGKYETLDYAIRKTGWPNIDLIPANLNLGLIDTSLPIALAEARSAEEKTEIIERLAYGILSLNEKYDLIIVDGTPSLNLLTISTLIACDHVIVPCPAQMADYASTIQFFHNLKNSVHSFVNNGVEVSFPDYHILITKYANAKYSNWMTAMIRKTFGAKTLDNVVKKTDEIGKTGTKITTIFERQPSKMSNRKSHNNATEIFSSVFDEIEQKIISPFCRGDDVFDDDFLVRNSKEVVV
ncbi:MAG: AAA family ATPase [Gammaproteobacteria bacterium]